MRCVNEAKKDPRLDLMTRLMSAKMGMRKKREKCTLAWVQFGDKSQEMIIRKRNKTRLDTGAIRAVRKGRSLRHEAIVHQRCLSTRENKIEG